MGSLALVGELYEIKLGEKKRPTLMPEYQRRSRKGPKDGLLPLHLQNKISCITQSKSFRQFYARKNRKLKCQLNSNSKVFGQGDLRLLIIY